MIDLSKDIPDILLRYALLISIYVILGIIFIADFPLPVPLVSLLMMIVIFGMFKRRQRFSLLLGNMFFVVALLIAWMNRGQFDLFDSMIQVLLLGLVIKLSIIRVTRDFLWIILILFFLVAGIAVSTTSMSFVPFLIVFLIILGQYFIQWNAARYHEACREHQVAQLQKTIQTLDGLGLRFDSSQVTLTQKKQTPPVRKQWGMLTFAWVLTIGLALPIYFLIPRFSTNTFLPPVRLNYTSRMEDSWSLSGFSDRVKLSTNGADITKSMAVAIYAKPTSSPKKKQIRLRGTALDNFSGDSWTRTTQARYDGQLYMFSVAGYPQQDISIIQVAGLSKYLFAESFPTFFPQHYSQNMTGQHGVKLFIDGESGCCLVDPESAMRELRYKSSGMVEYLENRPNVDVFIATLQDQQVKVDSDVYRLDPIYEKKCLELPPINTQRMQNLLNSWDVINKTPYETAMRIEAVLQAGYRYSLQTPKISSNINPLEYFLYTGRSGHCEYFASAMAILLRMRGIPSRLVTGYVSNEWNESAGTFVVRQSDAHAWVEAYFTNYGWMTFDPTPGNVLGFRQSVNPFLQKLNTYFDVAKMNWYRLFIDYDMNSQPRWIWRMDAFIGQLIFSPLRFYQSNSWKGIGIRIVVLAIIVLCAGYCIVSIYRMTQKKKRGATMTSRHCRVINTDPKFCDMTPYRDVLLWLKRHLHLVRLPKETPLEFAERIGTGSTKKEQQSLFYKLTAIYYKVHFGKSKMTSDDEREFDQFKKDNKIK